MKPLTETWSWSLHHPVETLWPLLSDTARYNEVIGVPKHTIEERLDPDGRVRFFGRARYGPFSLEWEDSPVNWVRHQWHEHVRHFRNGPFDLFAATLELEPDGDRAQCRYTIRLEPRGLLGRPVCTIFMRESREKIARVMRDAERFLDGASTRLFDYQAPATSQTVRARVGRFIDTIEATPYGHGLARRIAEWVLDAQEVDVARIRPLALARDFDVPERVIIEACLASARAGLLGTRWEILCPRCRVGKVRADRLEDLPDDAHCSSCNINYDRDFSRNVELSFHPAPAVRPVAHGEFCWLGPSSTPHVMAQVTLAPGESKPVEIRLPAGEYRVRTLEAGGQIDIGFEPDAPPSISVDATGAVEPALPTPGFHNHGDAIRTAIIERREWVADALTAHRVTTIQGFHDLFSDELLRPGDEVGVEHAVFMFTDLKGSTALYNRVGDARAYHLVREHFALLTDVVRAHDGAIVKTIGDGIHATFFDPERALACGIAIQERVAEFNAGSELDNMTIRVGLHTGASISVTINDRLDYYGATVNLAARLEGQGEGGDVMMSDTFASDPGVSAALAAYPVERRSAELKGFEGEQVYFRLSHAALRSVGSAHTTPQPAISQGWNST